MEDFRCSACGTPHPVYYPDGQCYTCFNMVVGQWRDEILTNNDIPYIDDSDRLHNTLPLNAPQGKGMGLDYYYTGKACKTAPHMRKESVEGRRRCLNCVNPRADARRSNNPRYEATDPCDKCGKHTRRTQDNKCVGCLLIKCDGRSSTSGDFQRANPALILSRNGARQYGLKVYRTGRPCNRGHNVYRYVSTGGCVDCARGES